MPRQNFDDGGLQFVLERRAPGWWVLPYRQLKVSNILILVITQITENISPLISSAKLGNKTSNSG